MELQLSLLDPFLDQLVEDSDVRRFFDSGFTFRFCLLLGSLEDGDLRQELIVVMLQCLLLAGGILAVESSLLSVVI